MARPFYRQTWQEFLKHGGEVTGFREKRWATVEKIKKGDYLLCYLTGVSRFIGILEVTGPAYKDDSPIWKDEEFPCRLPVTMVVELTPETALPVHDLKEVLSIFKNLSFPHAWTGHFRGSPANWKKSDGEALVDALQKEKENPHIRPLDVKKLGYRPKKNRQQQKEEPTSQEIETTNGTLHTEIQYRLLDLGSQMGYKVWPAKNDQNREWNGKKLSAIANMAKKIPVQFDEKTNKIIALIDVLWLKGNSIVAAFEIECTTSV